LQNNSLLIKIWNLQRAFLPPAILGPFPGGGGKVFSIYSCTFDFETCEHDVDFENVSDRKNLPDRSSAFLRFLGLQTVKRGERS